MAGKVCFLFGHRDAPQRVRTALLAAVERQAEAGAETFVVGSRGQFDAMAASAVRELKRRRPELALLMLTPYAQAARTLPEGFDGAVCPPGLASVPARLRLVRANRAMIDDCDCVIAYAWEPGSNALRLAEYAQRRAGAGEKTIVLLLP